MTSPAYTVSNDRLENHLGKLYEMPPLEPAAMNLQVSHDFAVQRTKSLLYGRDVERGTTHYAAQQDTYARGDEYTDSFLGIWGAHEPPHGDGLDIVIAQSEIPPERLPNFSPPDALSLLSRVGGLVVGCSRRSIRAMGLVSTAMGAVQEHTTKIFYVHEREKAVQAGEQNFVEFIDLVLPQEGGHEGWYRLYNRYLAERASAVEFKFARFMVRHCWHLVGADSEQNTIGVADVISDIISEPSLGEADYEHKLSLARQAQANFKQKIEKLFGHLLGLAEGSEELSFIQENFEHCLALGHQHTAAGSPLYVNAPDLVA